MADFQLRRQRFFLANQIRKEDASWTYYVHGLPTATTLDTAGYIKSVKVTSTKRQQEIVLSFEPAPANRVTKNDSPHKFVQISFAEFRLQYPPEPGSLETVSATAKESADYMVRMLRSGLKINDVTYHFYGHSNSQLKSRSCLLFAASKDVISAKIEDLGDFSKMKSVGKKAKRIGLLFSSAEVALSVLDPNKCEDIPDISTKDYIFTDGCGLIAPEFARLLAKKRNIVYRNVRTVPSVFQIRYRGYKGVLMVDPTMKGGDKWAKFRDSMKKFKGGDDHSFSVVAHSKPYTFGNLNDELILLIHSLGISTEALLQKQQANFQYFDSALTDPKIAFMFLTYINRMDLAERLLLDGVDAIQPEIRRLINGEYNKLLNKREDQRCRILIPHSRILFGICDPWGVLKEGECAVRVTLGGDGRQMTLQGAEVLVGRNPCLHPGDVRKLKAVRRPELEHLVDCIVFPTKGKRPPPDMMSGGDLDGDQFFVTWDKDIIPRFMSLPAEYPGGREPIKFEKITDDDRLEYFARYTNASLGRVKNLYLEWARVKGAMSPECQELNRLFSSCVDGNRIRVPQKLESAPRPDESTEPFILDVLHQHSKGHIQQRQQEFNSLQGYTFDAIEMLLARDILAMSEFEAFKLTYRWCTKNDYDIAHFLHFFDFGMLKHGEKEWVLSLLPVTLGYPALIMNGLLQSSLVTESELIPFKLHVQGMRWKRYFSSTEHRLGLLLDCLGRALNLFHKKIIFLRVDERLTVAIYVPKKIESTEETVVDDRVRLFAFTHSHDGSNRHRLAVPTKKDYRIYYDRNAFQLYEKARANSWVFLNRSQTDEAEYRNVAGKGDRRRARQATVESGTNYDWRASIALDKFSQNLQRHIGRVRRNGVLAAEIYVISNRDIQSQQLLDLWLEQIDTEETLQLFEKKAKEYTIPQVVEADWSAEEPTVVRIIRDKDLAFFGSLSNVGQFQEVFAWLWSRDERGRLGEIFDYLLLQFSLPPNVATCSARPGLFEMMVGFLVKAPYVAITFTRMARQTLSMDLRTKLEDAVPKILTALVLCVNEIEEMVIPPFKAMLSMVRQLTLTKLSELVETISLAVSSPELALDILLEGIESESNRVLVGRPRALQHFIRNLIGIAMEQIDQANESKTNAKYLYDLKPSKKEGYLNTNLRIDAPKSDQPRVGDHVRLIAASSPVNLPVKRRYRMSAVVESGAQGFCTFKCIHPPPPYFEECSWRLQNCGSFVTGRTMMDAVVKFATEKKAVCDIYELLLDLPAAWDEDEDEDEDLIPLVEYKEYENLNHAQNEAVRAAITSRLTCLWGPPGTGKTYTIVVILQELLKRNPQARVLVAAPTHNATDNVMQKFLDKTQDTSSFSPLRLSTDVHKVVSSLQKYTCDAMVGKDLNENPEARKKVTKRLEASRLIFTTCAGAGLGLLRTETFDIVIIDEASQQTEPISLIPLVKGCNHAVLVGDHVQLRATVQRHAQLEMFDVSLFERLYREHSGSGGVRKVMLDTQYRMHQQICDMNSREFYDGKLKTGVLDGSRPLPESDFPWPKTSRLVFVPCSENEDMGQKSKSNKAQAEITREIVKKLRTASQASTIAILTPYTRQKELMDRMIPGETVSSVDAYQGREADIVVFVTVRCNVHRELGFLKDMRRLNVALTRAKVALVLVGDKATLTAGEDPSAAVWARVVRDCKVVEIAVEDAGEGTK